MALKSKQSALFSNLVLLQYLTVRMDYYRHYIRTEITCSPLAQQTLQREDADGRGTYEDLF